MAESLLSSRIDQLRAAIVYLKMDELLHLCKALGISASGQKRELLIRIMALVEQSPASAQSPKRRVKRRKQEYRLDATMDPESYTNGRESRIFLKQQIGEHFHFTTFGMDWIREKWAEGIPPTFLAFIAFWEAEYSARKNGKTYTSKPELARVNFFRRMSQLQRYTKLELESMWAAERLRQVNVVRSILNWK